VGLIAAVVLAVWAAPALARSTWLYVEFDGSGTGVAQNATGNGGTAQLNASWTLLYKLPMQVLGSTFSVACQGSSCLYPRAPAACIRMPRAGLAPPRLPARPPPPRTAQARSRWIRPTTARPTSFGT